MGRRFPLGNIWEKGKIRDINLFQNRTEKKKMAKPYKTSDPVSNKFLMGILCPVSDRTRQIRMIYYTLYQRELERSQEHTLRPFHPLSASGSINFLDSTKTKNLSVETRWNSSLLAWKHYYLRGHCFKSVAFELLIGTRAGRYLLVGLVQAPKCFTMLFYPVCLSSSVFSS